MPVDAPAVKKEAVKGYGAQITECVNTKEVSHKFRPCRLLGGISP